MKKLISMFSAITLITLSSMPICAANEAANENDTNISDSVLITDVETIRSGIENFFNKNGIEAVWGLTDDGKGIFIQYCDNKTKIETEKFIQESGYDPNCIMMMSALWYGSEVIAEKINNYVEENGIDAFAYVVGSNEVLENDELVSTGMTHVVYYSDNKEARTSIELFIKDNIYDANMVIFDEMTESDDGKISNIFEIKRILTDFVKDNGYNNRIWLANGNEFFGHWVCVEIADYWTHKSTKESILKYIEEKNIDSSLIALDELEGGWEVPSDAFPASEPVNATLKGDADVNGEVGLSDVVAVSKHNINSTAYPLANETAEVNADMNNDNVVDGLDTQALVEFNLGKK